MILLGYYHDHLLNKLSPSLEVLGVQGLKFVCFWLFWAVPYDMQYLSLYRD